MTITLNGTTGITNDGGYTGDGVVFADTTPANTLVTTTGGNVGIGTSSLSNGVRTVIQGSQTGGAPQTSGTAQTYGLLRLQGTSFTSVLDFGTNGGNYNWIQATDSSNLATNYNLVINPNGGNLLVGTTTNSANTGIVVQCNSGVRSGIGTQTTHSGSNASMYFTNPNGQVGSIITSGSSTNYNTSSDYRLKHDIAPMTGALDRVIALKPVTYKWNADGSDGEGFIAHELAEVVPDAVTGEKDAVKEDGSIKPQGIDTSFLVATLTAAIQEQQAIITALTARVTALEGQA